MPRRVDSAEDAEPANTATKKRRPNTTQRGTTKPAARTRKAARSKTAAPLSEPLITTIWASRRTVESLDGIDDIDEVTPKKQTTKPAFRVADSPFLPFRVLMMGDVDRIPAVDRLAVHKNKVQEVSNWLWQFPHHRQVRMHSLSPLTGEIPRAIWTCGGRQINDCPESRKIIRLPGRRMDKPYRRK